MRVCVINPNYYRSSGVTVAIKRIYQGAADLNIDWFFVDCAHGTENEIERIDWLRSDSNSIFYAKLMLLNPLVLAFSVYALARFLLKNKIDIVHVHHRRLALLCSVVAKLLNIKVLYTGHLVYKDNWLFRFCPIDAAIAISKSVHENLSRTTKISKVFDISNAALFEEFPVKLDPAFYKTISCIARLESVKNHSNLLLAWAKLDPVKNGYMLNLIGEGSLKTELEELAKRIGVLESVNFVGYTKETKKYICNSLFLILPSFVEGQPIVVLEAAGCARATLVSNIGGSVDCVPDGSVLTNKVDPNSVDEISSAIGLWMRHPEQVVEEGVLFYNYWKNRASPSEVAKHHYAAYSFLTR